MRALAAILLGLLAGCTTTSSSGAARPAAEPPSPGRSEEVQAHQRVIAELDRLEAQHRELTHFDLEYGGERDGVSARWRVAWRRDLGMLLQVEGGGSGMAVAMLGDRITLVRSGLSADGVVSLDLRARTAPLLQAARDFRGLDDGGIRLLERDPLAAGRFLSLRLSGSADGSQNLAFGLEARGEGRSPLGWLAPLRSAPWTGAIEAERIRFENGQGLNLDIDRVSGVIQGIEFRNAAGESFRLELRKAVFATPPDLWALEQSMRTGTAPAPDAELLEAMMAASFALAGLRRWADRLNVVEWSDRPVDVNDSANAFAGTYLGAVIYDAVPPITALRGRIDALVAELAARPAPPDDPQELAAYRRDAADRIERLRTAIGEEVPQALTQASEYFLALERSLPAVERAKQPRTFEAERAGLKRAAVILTESLLKQLDEETKPFVTGG